MEDAKKEIHPAIKKQIKKIRGIINTLDKNASIFAYLADEMEILFKDFEDSLEPNWNPGLEQDYECRWDECIRPV